MAGKAYQLASDGYWGLAFSGVIKADGTWVPCADDHGDWNAYMDWFAQGNRADPWLPLADGGVKIVLKEGEVAVGSMLDSLPPEEGGNPMSAASAVPAAFLPAPKEAPAAPAPMPPPQAAPKPPEHRTERR